MTGFNDLTIAPNGNVVVGALGPGALNPHSVDPHAPPPPVGAGTGAFYEIGREGHRLLADDIGHPNGVAFAPAGDAVYVSDSLRRCVYRFAAGPAGWSERSVFAAFDGALPDGMAVASDGCLWLALALAAELVVLSPSGAVQRRIATGAPLTTSVHFGGADLRTAFVTSGSHAGDEPRDIAGHHGPRRRASAPASRVVTRRGDHGRSWIERLFAGLRHAIDAMAWLAGAGIILLMIPTLVDVFYREVFGPSVPGMVEYSELGLVAVIFLGIASALTHDVHIHTPVLTSRVSPRAAHRMRVAGRLVMWVVIAACLYGTIMEAQDSFAIREYRFGLIEVPIWPAKIIVPVGLAALLVEITMQCLEGLFLSRPAHDESRDHAG